MKNINTTNNTKECENAIKDTRESIDDVISINFNKFLADVGVSKEDYFKLVPSMKFIFENYSIDSPKCEKEETFLLKNGTAISLKEALSLCETNPHLLNQIFRPNKEIRLAALKRFPHQLKYLAEQTEEEILVALHSDLLAFKHAKLQTQPIVKLALNNISNLTQLKEGVITAEIVLEVLKKKPHNFTYLIRQSDIELEVFREILRHSFVKKMFLEANIRLLSSYTIGELLSYEDLVDFCISYSAKFSSQNKAKLSYIS